jgi:6-phosphogluconolactonase
MSVEIEIVDDPARACAAIMVGAAADGGHVVLAGGSTPRAANEEFVAAVKAVGLDLSATTFWFGDERAVAPDDDRSNFKMVHESLIDPLGEDMLGRVLRIEGELGYAEAAAAYERELRAAGPPEFDLMLLGIGPDGHTLSLFPDQDTLSERSRLVVGVPEAAHEPFVPRASMTFPAVARARHVVVLASGSSKADAIVAAFGPDAEQTQHVPSSMLGSFAQRLTVLIDPAAAARL